MVVDKNIYPDRTTALSAIQLTSTQPSSLALDTEWNTTIAVSESTSDLAAFNKITYITFDPLYPNDFHEDEQIKLFQKIGLYYTQNYINFAANQYYNGSVNYDGAYYFIGDTSSAYYNFYSLRRYPVAGQWTTGVVSAMQQRYNKNAYYLITGLDLTKALCVVCVGFTDRSYCSLKYYEDHKLSINKTPMCLFMIGLIDNDGGNNLQTMCPIDMVDAPYTYYYRAAISGEITSDSSTFQYLLPSGIIGPQTNIGDRNTVGSIQTGALVFPLVACMAGGSINARQDYWDRYNIAGTPIYGGTMGIDYTVENESGQIHTILTQAGFDSALKAAACYGLPFSLEFPTNRYDFYDEDLTTFLPRANEGGYFNGSYDVLTNNGIGTELYYTDPIFNGGKNAPYSGRDYDPNVPVPVDDIELTTPTLTSAGAFFTSYILNNSDLTQVAKFLNSNDGGIIDNLIDSLRLYGNTPIDAFISLQLFPLDVKETTGANNLVNMMVGRIPIIDPSTGNPLQTYEVPRNAFGVVDFGGFDIPRKFQCYLDFEPYTSIQLYIPYCGTVNLQPSIFVGHKVRVKMAIDWITGACAAVVMVSTEDGYKPVEYVNGQLGQNIEMTASTYTQNYASVVAAGVKGIGQTLMGAGMLAVGNPAGTSTLGSGLSNLWEANSKWHETEFKTSGSNTPGANNYFPKQCYITISYPIPLIDNEQDLKTYGHSNGFACVKTVQSLDEIVQTNSAYGTMQAAIQTFNLPDPQGLGHIPPTPQEVEMIKKILAEGFSIFYYQEPTPPVP